MPGAPSSVLVTTSKALVSTSFLLLLVGHLLLHPGNVGPKHRTRTVICTVGWDTTDHSMNELSQA